MAGSIKFVLICIFLSALAGLVRFISGAPEKAGKESLPECVNKIETVEVRGESLAPQILLGQNVRLLHGYYNCHPIQTDDIVAYNYAGNGVPIIKIVKAVPGDKWRIEKDEVLNLYRIIVNDLALENSEGKIYRIPEADIKILKLYAASYPVIPPDSYLILGNVVSGSIDSTKFGLVGSKDIIAKVDAECF